MGPGDCAGQPGEDAAHRATNLRARGGRPWATDGPYAESKKVIGGYYLIDVADRDEAVGLASMLAELTKPYCAVEIRPIHTD